MGEHRTLALLLACSAAAQAQSFNFRPGMVYPAGNGPLAITSGDFNGDGRPDLALGNAASNNVSIYLGNGDGSFTAGAPVPLPGCVASYLGTGDFNHDGHTDLIAACQYQNAIWVLPGLGNGTFGTPISTTLANLITFFGYGLGYFQNYCVADFNNDGIPDLVIGLTDSSFDRQSFSIGLLLSKGDGTFQSPVTVVSFPSEPVPTDVLVGDLNGDGDQDVIVINEQETVGNSLLSKTGSCTLK
jgi:hypothetical protein